MTTGEAQNFEQRIVDLQPVLCEGLPRFGLKQERRRIRLNIKETDITVDNDIVTLSFFLPAGAYATTIMRELIDYTDLTERVDINMNRNSTAITQAELNISVDNTELKT